MVRTVPRAVRAHSRQAVAHPERRAPWPPLSCRRSSPMPMLPGLPPRLLRRVLLLLFVAIPPLLPAAPAPAQSLPAAWRATGIRILETYRALCVDALQPETVLLAVEGTGTVAY